MRVANNFLTKTRLEAINSFVAWLILQEQNSSIDIGKHRALGFILINRIEFSNGTAARVTLSLQKCNIYVANLASRILFQRLHPLWMHSVQDTL